jgi:hypothetical protein
MSLESHLNRPGPRQRSVEIGVILFMCAFALLVIVGSVQVGIRWGAEGPKAGFFPFYFALLILASSIIISKSYPSKSLTIARLPSGDISPKDIPALLTARVALYHG